MSKSIFPLALSLAAFPLLGYAADSPYFSFKDGDHFKRFSISAGWLHAAPQGSANNFNTSTLVNNGDYKVGDVQLNSVTNAIAPTAAGNAAKAKLLGVTSIGQTLGLINNGVLTADMSGKVNINSLENWNSPNTGLEAESVDTLGIMANYFFTDHWSLE